MLPVKSDPFFLPVVTVFFTTTCTPRSGSVRLTTFSLILESHSFPRFLPF